MPDLTQHNPAYWESIIALLSKRGILPVQENTIIAKTPKTMGKSKVSTPPDVEDYSYKQSNLVDMYNQNRNFGIGDYL